MGPGSLNRIHFDEKHEIPYKYQTEKKAKLQGRLCIIYVFFSVLFSSYRRLTVTVIYKFCFRYIDLSISDEIQPLILSLFCYYPTTFCDRLVLFDSFFSQSNRYMILFFYDFLFN